MTTFYNNLPRTVSTNSADSTVQVFDQYTQATIELDNTVLMAMVGFFEQRGFGQDASESISITILRQASKDSLNAMQIIDTLRGLSDVEISSLVGEILNYNRFKTSSLGTYTATVPIDYVNRNIIA